MASTLLSPQAAAGIQAHSLPGAGVVIAARAKYTLIAALVINDVIQMVKVPKGACILEVILTSDDLDSSTGVVLAVGDGVTADRFISGSTVGQAGGIVRMGSGVTAANQSGASAFQYTVDDTVDVKVTTAPSGTAATTGDIVLTVLYSMEP